MDDAAAPLRPPPRVLFLLENYPAPSDRRVSAQSRALARAGYDVTVISPKGEKRDLDDYERVDDVSVHRYPFREGRGGPWSYLTEYGSALWHMRRIARRLAGEQGFQAVHLCNPPDVLFLAIGFLRRRGAVVVFDQHDLVPELYDLRFGGRRGPLYRAAAFFERLTYSVAKVVIVPNESYRRIAIERGGKRPEDVFVVRIAPDLARFTPVPPDDALKRGRRHLIAYVGTIGPQDGLDHALRALQQLCAERDDWHTIVAGSGDALADAKSLSRTLGLDGRVEFVGFLGDEDVIRLISSADVCLSPEPSNSLNDASTMVKVMEYMALARPIVAFDLPETRFSAGDGALYARPNDDAAYAGCIGRLLDDPDLRAEVGAAGRTRLEESLSWAHSERQLIAAYERALGDRAPT